MSRNQAGYSGRDAMRERAEKAFGHKASCSKKTPKMNEGGMLNAAQTPMEQFVRPPVGISPLVPKPIMLKRGGKVQKKAEGGMLDARPPMRTAVQPAPETAAMKRGGKARRRMNEGGMPFDPATQTAMKHGGHVKKMAMGGVGKIRHKQSTASGKQIGNKRIDVN